MLTTGFKLWFGFFVGAVLAAVFAGYTSGATETGPLSLGWKGGVGNHVSYTILVMGAGVLALLGLVAVAFRDADAGAQADFLGLVHDLGPLCSSGAVVFTPRPAIAENGACPRPAL